MANAVRGEVAMKAGDRVFTVRPSFDLMARLETVLDAGVGVLIKMARADCLRETQVIQCAALCLRDADPSLDADASVALAMEAGADAFAAHTNGQSFGPLLELVMMMKYGPDCFREMIEEDAETEEEGEPGKPEGQD